MADETVTRKLATILAADVAGYSRLTADDEEATHRTLTAYRTIIFDLLKKHQGRLVDTAGDSVLADFASAVEAVRCAISIQEELAVRNAELPEERRMHFRIGINVGDVIVEDGDIFGDAVNVAAWLESVAPPGSVCISGSTFEQVKNKLSIGFTDIGPQHVKNIPYPVEAFQLTGAPVRAQPLAPASRRPIWVGAVVALVVAVAGVGAYAVWSGERAAERAAALRLKSEAAAKQAAEARQLLQETQRQVAAERARAAEERRRRDEAEAKRRAEEEARRKTEAAAQRRAAELARRRAAAAAASGRQVAVVPSVLNGAQLRSLLVGHTARFRRRHRFKPGSVEFRLRFQSGGALQVACSFHPDHSPSDSFPCNNDGKTVRWSMPGDQVCWAIVGHICFRAVRTGGSYAMQPMPGAERAILRGPFVIER